MEVKVKTNPSPKSNPSINQPPQNLNLQSNQLDQITALLQQLLEKVSESRQKIQQQLQANSQPGLYSQPQQKQNDVFIVKASMKASMVDLRVEGILLEKKKIVMSALGFALPVQVDAVMLIRKDFDRKGIKLTISNIELFEEVVETINGNKKTITGLKITLSI